MIFLLGSVCVFAWFYPVEKTDAAFGRYSYTELMLAVVSTFALASITSVQIITRNRFRKSAFRIAALWLGCGSVLVAVEVAALWMPVHNNPFYLYNSGDMTRHDLPDHRLPFVRTAGLRWEGWSYGNIGAETPDRSDRRWINFETDAQGFRNPNTSATADLIFVGDSFTEAGNVPLEESFATMAADKLRLSARNLGICGLCPPEEAVVLECFGLPCRPKIIVWQIYEGNDLPESWRYQEWAKLGYPPKERQGTSSQEQWSITHMIYRQFVSRKRLWLSGQFKTSSSETIDVRFDPTNPDNTLPFLYDEWGSVKSTHPGWSPLTSAIRDGHRLLGNSGSQLVLLFIPTKNHVMDRFVTLDNFSRQRTTSLWPVSDDHLMAGHLRKFCDELSVPFIDATDAMIEAASKGQLVFLQTDTHLSPLGNEVVCDVLIKKITELTAQTKQ